MKTMLRPLSQAPQHGEQALDLGRGQRRGRLVQDDDARARKQHAAQFDQLLHADGKRTHGRMGVDGDPQPPQMVIGLARHAAPIDDAEARRGLAAQKHILGDLRSR